MISTKPMKKIYQTTKPMKQMSQTTKPMQMPNKLYKAPKIDNSASSDRKDRGWNAKNGAWAMIPAFKPKAKIIRYKQK